MRRLAFFIVLATLALAACTKDSNLTVAPAVPDRGPIKVATIPSPSYTTTPVTVK